MKESEAARQVEIENMEKEDKKAYLEISEMFDKLNELKEKEKKKADKLPNASLTSQNEEI